MTKKVVALGAVHRIPGPQPGVVEVLTDLLARAKKGDIKGVACAYVDGADAINSDWCCGNADSNDMVAATSQLWFVMMKRKHEDD